MKKQSLGLFQFLILLVCNSCLFQPDVEVSIKTPPSTKTVPRRTYLSILKSQATHTVTVDQLQDMAAKLLTTETDSAGRSVVPAAPSQITGVNKLIGIGGQKFPVSSVSRAAGVIEEEPVAVYAFTTEKASTDAPGFVLTCNDNRIGNILAIVDQGNPEAVDVPFLDVYYTNLQAYIDHTIAEYNSITDEEIAQVVSMVKQQNANRSNRGSGVGYYEGDGYHIEENYNDSDNTEYGWGLIVCETRDDLGTGYFSGFDIPGYHLPIMYAVWFWEGGDYATLPTEWHQKKPYNYIFTEYMSLDVDFLLTGCGPTALGQIMAYHKYPLSYTYIDTEPYAPDYYGTIYDWDALTEYPEVDSENQELMENVSILMYEIGKRADAVYEADQTPPYGAPRTTTWEWSLINALEEMGYNVPDFSYANGKKAFVPYNFDTVLLSIIDEKPVIVSGYATKELNEEGQFEFKNGHVWVIDGTRYMGYAETFTNGNIAYMGLDTWVHCNAGWGPHADNIAQNRFNGWYRSDVYEMNLDTNHVSFIRSLGLEEGEDSNFQYKIQILPFVSPLEEDEEE